MLYINFEKYDKTVDNTKDNDNKNKNEEAYEPKENDSQENDWTHENDKENDVSEAGSPNILNETVIPQVRIEQESNTIPLTPSTIVFFSI